MERLSAVLSWTHWPQAAKKPTRRQIIAIKSDSKDNGLIILITTCQEDLKLEHSVLKSSAVLFRILTSLLTS